MPNPLLTTIVQDKNNLILNEGRQKSLDDLVGYLLHRLSQGEKASILFVCTHNSRRSQFSQVWGQFAADHFDLAVQCFSGGTEVTACNPRTIDSLHRSGLIIERKEQGDDNPRYLVSSAENEHCVELFSKVVDDPINPTDNFAAVMTCDHADKNCPTIFGADRRIPIRYEDPKAFDNSPQEAVMYDNRSRQIATEMFYVMKKTKEALLQH